MLRRLNPGTFYFQGRAIAMDRVLVKVAGVLTTHPEAGSVKYKAKTPPAPSAIKALLPKLADLPQAAEEEAKTVSGLAKQLREAKAELRRAAHSVPVPAVNKSLTTVNKKCDTGNKNCS